MMNYLQKYPFSITMKPFNHKLIDMCLFNQDYVMEFETRGLEFIRNLIRTVEKIDPETLDFLRETLFRLDEQPHLYTENGRAMAYLLLAELAERHFELIFQGEIKFALKVFQAL